MENDKTAKNDSVCGKCGTTVNSETSCCGQATKKNKDGDNENWVESYKCMTCGGASEGPITCCGKLAERVD